MLALETLERCRLTYDLAWCYIIRFWMVIAIRYWPLHLVLVSHVALIVNLPNKRVVLMSEKFLLQ